MDKENNISSLGSTELGEQKPKVKNWLEPESSCEGDRLKLIEKRGKKMLASVLTSIIKEPNFSN